MDSVAAPTGAAATSPTRSAAARWSGIDLDVFLLERLRRHLHHERVVVAEGRQSEGGPVLGTREVERPGVSRGGVAGIVEAVAEFARGREGAGEIVEPIKRVNA